MPDFENDVPPFFGRQLHRWRRRARWTQRIRRHSPVLDAMPLAAHFVRVPTLVPDHLRAIVGNVLGDRCQKVRSRKNLLVAVDLLIQFGTVDDLLTPGVEGHFGDRKRVAQNILDKLFEDGLVFGRNASALMHVKTAVFPRMQKTDAVMGERIEVDQRLDHMGAEDFPQGIDGRFGEGVELAVLGE